MTLARGEFKVTIKDRIWAPAAGALLALAVLLIGRQAGAGWGFPMDDSWIHMVYGRALAGEGLLAYNPGQPATGCTAPAWAACVGLAHLLLGGISTHAVVVGVMILGLVCHLLTIWFVQDLVFKMTDNTRCAQLGGLLTALSPALAVGALSGMEVALAGLLLVLAGRALWLGQWGRSGLWLAVGCAVRPEAAVVAALTGGLALLSLILREKRFPGRAILGLAVPLLLFAALLVGYNLKAGGHPLPATFYFKQDSSLAALPGRVGVGLSALLTQVPPFFGFVGWAALAGYVLRRRPLPEMLRLLLPLAGGLGFLLANLYVSRPDDPAAFYHLRYVLPCVPLLVVALVVGAEGLAARLKGRAALAPAAVLLLVGLVGTAATLLPVSRTYHNDVRNINQVQVAMGRWLADHTRPEAWVAATDAGAVRYFSGRPTVDLMGLNTPDFYWDRRAYVTGHPVDALAVMLAWVRPTDLSRLRSYAVMKTDDYTITSNPRMAEQTILGVPDGDTPVFLEFQGIRHFPVMVNPGRLRLPGTAESTGR